MDKQKNNVDLIKSGDIKQVENLTRGVIITAVRITYVKEAIELAKSIKKHSNLSITLFTDHPKIAEKTKLFDQIHLINNQECLDQGLKWSAFAKLNKIKAMATFPYDLTLYLDCDALMIKPVNELFDMVLKYDLLICNSPKLNKTTVPFKLIKYQRKNAYNSGVILYKNNDVIRNLFDQWLRDAKNDKKIFKNIDGGFYDQPKLRKLLNNSTDIKIKVVPNTVYNARHTMINQMKKDKLIKKIKILHSRVKI